MQNGNYEILVEQITDLVLSRLEDDALCPTFCRADVERIVDAGAERIGIVLGSTATAHDWASLIDHTLLKPEASESDIRKLCSDVDSIARLPMIGLSRELSTARRWGRGR